MQARILFTLLLGFSSAFAEVSFENFREVVSQRCAACHNDVSAAANGGNLSMETRESMLKGGSKGPAMTVGNGQGSLIYAFTQLPAESPLAMPPGDRFERLAKAETDIIKAWIDAGAKWPKGERISYSARTPGPGEISADEMARVKAIHDKIVATAARTDGDSYTEKLEGTRAKLKMMPIPAGEIVMRGTAKDDVYTAVLPAFWMGEKEIPWDIYNLFMVPTDLRDKDGFPQKTVATDDLILAQPSKPYHAMSYGMSVRRHPAISMTHHAANKFCQWLSWQTGRFYRLPTEAEWEYAARAGTTTAYPWGDEPTSETVDSIAWYFENSNGTYNRMGRKQANAFGLKDMLGNVAEWTLDYGVENRRATLGSDRVESPWIKTTAAYPHVVKGGHYNSQPADLSYAARELSTLKWKESDPQNPKSIWYHTSITTVGFRVVSPNEIPSAEEMYQYWNTGYAYDDTPPAKPAEKNE